MLELISAFVSGISRLGWRELELPGGYPVMVPPASALTFLLE